MKTKTVYPVKVSPQGQITLPKALRDRLRVQKGKTRLYVNLKGNELSVSGDPPIVKYRGALAPRPGEPSAIDFVKEMREQQNQKTLETFRIKDK